MKSVKHWMYLIFNGVDALPDGGTLTLRTNASPSALSPQVDVEIADTGQGMNEETRRRCLELGVAWRHNAEIEIESTPGVGTTMRLSCPVAAPQAAESAPANKLAIPSRAQGIEVFQAAQGDAQFAVVITRIWECLAAAGSRAQ